MIISQVYAPGPCQTEATERDGLLLSSVKDVLIIFFLTCSI